MIYQTPRPDELDVRVIAMIDELRDQLRDRVAEPRRWSGGLRKMALARAVQASNSIEGYNATLDDVVAAVAGEEPLEADEETQFAVTGYRDAMTYVLQLAQDPLARIDENLLKSLHFMMLKHDLTKHPGRWRPGAIYVREESTGEIVYEGPDSDLVPILVHEMLDDLDGDTGHVLIRAAMAHLNLVLIHPFSDGNGRMARCMQTLVLAREQIVAPIFSSIEEYLGRNTPAYYAVLADVAQGHWTPERDARPWVRFCLTAHYRQARTHLRRIEEFGELWVRCVDLAKELGLPERTIGALGDAAYGLRMRNRVYRSVVETTDGEEISELTATRDLKAIVQAGLFHPVGERRGRYYVATEELRRVWQKIRSRRPPRDDDDPFVLAEQANQLTLVAE